jgi:hypothetical protein
MTRGLAAVVLPIALTAGGVAWAAPASTRAEYIAQADPICHEMSDAILRKTRGLQGDKKNGRFKAAARKIRAENAIYASGIPRIAAVEPPTADAQRIGTWVEMLLAQGPLAKHLARDYAHGHLFTNNRVRLIELSNQTQALVTGFGFQYCQLL